ncbi:MAG: hypothetical protein V3S43_06370 [Acidimicrobiia bacterium]
MDTTAEFTHYLATVTVGAPVVWATSEVLARAFKAKAHELKIAMVIGPTYGVFFLLFGWLPVLHVEMFPNWVNEVNLAFAGVSGLFSAGGAKIINDQVARRVGLKKKGGR